MDRIVVGRTLRAVLLALVVGGTVLLNALPAAAATPWSLASARTLHIKGHRVTPQRFVFSLRRVRGHRVVTARVVLRHHRRPVTRRVRREARAGKVVLRVPRTRSARRVRPVLVVTVAPVRSAQPASAPASVPAAPAGARATLQSPGAAILSDADAAARVSRSPFEPRPANGSANGHVPTADQLAAFRSASTNWGACGSFASHITGDFTGTTDEILQWAAWKWGLDEDLLRAVASKETWWNQAFVGDNGESFGLMQVKRGVQAGTFPLSRDSTAFNVDYYAAILRYYYDGCATWLNDVDHVGTYARGDIWGAVGAWYSGRWHTVAAEGYIAAVRTNLAGRVWAAVGF